MPPCAARKKPSRSCVAPVKAPFARAEQLGGGQLLGDGAQVDADEDLLAPRAALVDGAGDQLLARARLSADEHRHVQVRHLLDVLAHAPDAHAGAHHAQRVHGARCAAGSAQCSSTTTRSASSSGTPTASSSGRELPALLAAASPRQHHLDAVPGRQPHAARRALGRRPRACGSGRDPPAGRPARRPGRMKSGALRDSRTGAARGQRRPAAAARPRGGPWGARRWSARERAVNPLRHPSAATWRPWRCPRCLGLGWWCLPVVRAVDSTTRGHAGNKGSPLCAERAGRALP